MGVESDAGNRDCNTVLFNALTQHRVFQNQMPQTRRRKQSNRNTTWNKHAPLVPKVTIDNYTLHQQDRTAASGKTRGGELRIFVNNSSYTISKEVSSYCSPEVEYLMINYRSPYLPREFSSVFFVAVHIPPQSEAGTKTALNELYSNISKQENVHPEAALLVAGDFNAGKLISV